MNKRQKIVQGRFLDNEEAVINMLEDTYKKSLQDVTAKAQKLYDEIETLKAELDFIEDEEERKIQQSRIQSKVYQKQYQDGLKKQVSDILDKMHDENFKTVSDYLEKCYEDGFVGTIYDLQGQGIPFAFPIDQEAVTRAVQLDSKISNGLYSHLGEDVAQLKKHIASEVSRGISSGMTFNQIAQQLTFKMTGTYNNDGGSLAYAKRIARTEGHRIQCQAGMDACYKAKEKGADVVKQWDSTLDAKTRESHAMVDQEIREIDEPFSNGLMFPGDPSGRAEEVIHCRCALLQRARWAVKGGFTKMNNFTKQLESFDSPEEYAEFRKAFFSKENRNYMNYTEQMEEKHGTKDFQKLLEKMDKREYRHFSRLSEGNPLFRKKPINEGVFETFNNTKADSIRPKSIMLEMKKSKIGKEALEYINSNNVPVFLCYGVDNPDGVSGIYDPIDDIIRVYCDVTKTTKETALTVIHEATHRKLGSKGTFEEEVECFKAEVLHQKGRLTNSDIDDIIRHVEEHYPEIIKEGLT